MAHKDSREVLLPSHQFDTCCQQNIKNSKKSEKRNLKTWSVSTCIHLKKVSIVKKHGKMGIFSKKIGENRNMPKNMNLAPCNILGNKRIFQIPVAVVKCSIYLTWGMSHNHGNNYIRNEIILHNMPLRKKIVIMVFFIYCSVYDSSWDILPLPGPCA